MRAVYISEFGDDFGNIGLFDVPDLGGPAAGEVIVRVHSAGVNRADLLQARGLYPAPAGYSTNIPGLEFAGEIAAVGQEVPSWKMGDRVFGITAGEAQAEHLRIDHRLLMKIPERLGYSEAAAIPEAFITAHDAVFTQGGLKTGDILLIHAVGSGVGLAALQMAKAAGAYVIGTSRTAEKLDKCSEMGLDSAITVTDINELAVSVLRDSDGRGADVILDLVGGAYFQQNLICLASKGRLMLVGLTSGPKAEFNLSLVLQKRARIIGTVLRGRSVEEKAAATTSFADAYMAEVGSGSIRPNLDSVFTAAEAGNAYNYVASNRNLGKVVIDLSS